MKRRYRWSGRKDFTRRVNPATTRWDDLYEEALRLMKRADSFKATYPKAYISLMWNIRAAAERLARRAEDGL